MQLHKTDRYLAVLTPGKNVQSSRLKTRAAVLLQCCRRR